MLDIPLKASCVFSGIYHLCLNRVLLTIIVELYVFYLKVTLMRVPPVQPPVRIFVLFYYSPQPIIERTDHLHVCAFFRPFPLPPPLPPDPHFSIYILCVYSEVQCGGPCSPGAICLCLLILHGCCSSPPTSGWSLTRLQELQIYIMI